MFINFLFDKIKKFIKYISQKKQQTNIIQFSRSSYLSSQQQMASSQQQSNILLKQQLFDVSHQLQLIKIQNEHLVIQVTELKQKQKKLKQINDMLVQNLHKSQKQVNDQITLKIQGQFLTKRIHQLQEQLQKYRNGVSDSVDRRVKKIVNQYTQQKDLQYQKRKSRLSLGNNVQNNKKQSHYQTHQHKYYNIEYKTFTEPNSRQQSQENSTIQHQQSRNKTPSEDSFCQPYQINLHHKSICQKCFQLEELINEKDELIQKLEDKLKYLLKNQTKNNQYLQSQNHINSSENEQWKIKYYQLLKLYENLKEQHDMALDQYNNFTSSKQNDVESYTITQSPINGFKKKQVFQVNGQNNSIPCESRLYKQERGRQQQMLQQITNLVNGLGRSKKAQQKQQNHQHSRQTQQCYITDKKSRVSYMGGNSRISQAQSRLDNSSFTIKQGVNRYGNTGLF